MTNRTNFMRGSTDAEAEELALLEMCEYLVALGKYSSVIEAKIDALERVKFFSKLGLDTIDPQLLNASPARKSVHALIYGHELHEIIESGNGFLPEVR